MQFDKRVCATKRFPFLGSDFLHPILQLSSYREWPDAGYRYIPFSALKIFAIHIHLLIIHAPCPAPLQPPFRLLEL